MKKITLLLLAALGFIQVNAQKLPAVQTTSLRAPANIKIDGKTADWDDKFEAKNPTTDLLYTLANDDKKLYLVAQTDVETVIKRITNGGIKLVIQKNGSKSEIGAATVKFPYRQKGAAILTFSFLPSTAIRVTHFKNGNTTTTVKGMQPLSKDEEEKMADSLTKEYNKKLIGNLKWIYTHGITAVDSLIPIYNDKGIEAAVLFDNNKAYTYELAIDLKTLGLSAANGDKFSYHLIVNAEPNKYAVTLSNGIWMPGVTEETKQQVEALYAPFGATTDFWGEYTLAK